MADTLRHENRTPFKLRFLVSSEAWEGFISLQTKDVSTGGVLLLFSGTTPPSPASLIELKLEDRSIRGAVSYVVSAGRAAATGTQPGFGVRFLEEQAQRWWEGKPNQNPTQEGPGTPPPPSATPVSELLGLVSTLRETNPFEILAIPVADDDAAIRRAFFKLASKYHPDRFRTTQPDEREHATEYFLLAKKAFETLSDAVKRQEWLKRLAHTAKEASTGPPAAKVTSSRAKDSTSSRTEATAAPAKPVVAVTATTNASIRDAAIAAEAEKCFAEGKAHLKAKDYVKAQPLLERATLLGRKQQYLALELVCKGHQYLTARFFDRAKESFERAARMDHDCAEARLGLKELEQLPQKYASSNQAGPRRPR